MKKNTAFSMVELSVVLIVIGILASGIISASSLIKTSKLTTARSLTAKSTVPSIDGLVAWYETSAIDSLKTSESYNNAQISTWYDISPSSITLKKNTLTKTASSALTYTNKGINDFASLKFSGTGTNSSNDTNGKIALSSFYQGASARNTIFIVCRPSILSSSYSNIFIDSGNVSNISATGIAAANSVYFNLGSTSNTSTGANPAGFELEKNYILAIYFNGSSSKAFVNNTKNMAGGATTNPGTNFLTGLTIGSDRNGGYSFNGLISEVIIYNRPLQNKERTDVFKYLSNKYKIPVLGF